MNLSDVSSWKLNNRGLSLGCRIRRDQNVDTSRFGFAEICNAKQHLGLKVNEGHDAIVRREQPLLSSFCKCHGVTPLNSSSENLCCNFQLPCTNADLSASES